MKKHVAWLFFLASSSAMAQSCPVDIENEVHIKPTSFAIHQDGQESILVDDNNQLFINGEKQDLDEKQQQALESYTDSMQAYLPKMAEIANDGVGAVADVYDEVTASFDSQESFAKAKALIDEYSAKVHDKFYENGEFVLKTDTFDNIGSSWAAEFDEVMKHVSLESFSGLFDALSEEMKKGEMSLMELKRRFSELKEKITEKVEARSEHVEEKANELCDSVKGLAEEEQELHKLIPELKDYQVFEI